MKDPVVIGDKYTIPFSRGILTKSIEVVGIDTQIAYKIATDVYEYLVSEKIKTVSRDYIRELAYNKIKEYVNDERADSFLRFRHFKTLNKPLIILIGGSTGSGKSTISVELAHRLEITSVITTDIIREIMRYTISEKLMPYLHKSSYLGWKNLDIDSEIDPVILAFKQQSARVNVGIHGMIKRSIREKSTVIINGVHVLPSLIKAKDFEKGANIITLFTYIKNPDIHKRRFYYREESGEIRKADKYIENFKHIRKIQDYVIKEANRYKLPCIDNKDSKKVVQWIINYIAKKIK